jgi:adenosine deaminase
MSVESAWETYKAMLPYKDMVIGIGLDSDENDRPPSLFADLYTRARNDGFHITAHCDVGQKDTYQNIRQVALNLSLDRIDHGLNAATNTDLIRIIKDRGIGMTLTPWGYLRHEPVEEIFPRIRKLFDEGIPIAIGSDDPAYMEDCWILHDLLLVKRMCGFNDGDMMKLARDAVDMCWADEGVKDEIRREIDDVVAKYEKSWTGNPS